MKKKSLCLGAIIMLVVLLCTGCGETEIPVTQTKIFDGTKVKVDDVTTYNYLYIDLEDPDTILTAGDNTDWDIMITADKTIATNGGTTATTAASAGIGGVVFSGYTDFTTAVSISDAETLFTEKAGTDYTYWDKYKSTSTAGEQTGNAMSFPGYSAANGRDGTTEAAAWIWNDDVDFSLGTAYAQWERMTPNFSNFTNNVYLIKSGDGLTYYKFQITAAEYTKEEADTTTTYHYTYNTQFIKLQ